METRLWRPISALERAAGQRANQERISGTRRERSLSLVFECAARSVPEISRAWFHVKRRCLIDAKWLPVAHEITKPVHGELAVSRIYFELSQAVVRAADDEALI
ncbi:hypothetical protein ACWKSP_25605 [Micromonosporaceae bacterium Da 78-11]